MSVLLDEIQNGPLAAEIAPYFASGNDNAVAEILNKKDINTLGQIPRDKFIAWAASTGQRAVIEDVAIATNDALRPAALALLDVIRGGLESLDFTLQGVPELASAWYSAGKMTQDQRDQLLALAGIKVSRAEQLGISVSALDVAHAREIAQ